MILYPCLSFGVLIDEVVTKSISRFINLCKVWLLIIDRFNFIHNSFHRHVLILRSSSERVPKKILTNEPTKGVNTILFLIEL